MLVTEYCLCEHVHAVLHLRVEIDVAVICPQELEYGKQWETCILAHTASEALAVQFLRALVRKGGDACIHLYDIAYHA